MKYSFVILAACFCLSFSACKSSKKATDSTTIGRPTASVSADDMITALKEQQKDFTYFDSKMKAKVTMDGKTQSASVILRIIKDKVIWASFQKLGIEGARIRITPDSLVFVNRLDRTYVNAPISALTDLYDLPADFDMLQHLLLGEAPVLTGRPSEVEAGDETFMLQLMQPKFVSLEYTTNQSYEIKNMIYYDPSTKAAINVSQSDYQVLESSHNLPYFRDIHIKQGETEPTLLKLTTTRASFDKKSFTASIKIPSSYEPMDLGL